MDKDLDPVNGFIYTHADCPHCGEPNEYEGDCSSDQVRCTACGEEFEIGMVR